MRVIDFIGLGAEELVYVISGNGTPVLWQGTRRDFVREMTAFFMLFYQIVTGFDVGENDALILYI